MGRPKNPTTIKLERKIKKLEEIIEKLQSNQTVSAAPEGQTPLMGGVGLGVDYDSEKKLYNLRVLNYAVNGEAAKVVETRRGGDSPLRAEFEIKKFFAHELNRILQGKE